jgi:Icc-related predicted phosphoesterase
VRIHILSDLHIEFESFEVQAVDADVVVVAGDVHIGLQGLEWLQAHFPRTPVVYVLGNHEYYGQSVPELTDRVRRSAAGSDVHVLEREAVRIGGVTFLGCTLWTDFRLYGDPVAAEREAALRLTDYRRTRVRARNRRLRPADTARLHRVSLDWLKTALDGQRTSPVVVVTHHAPSPRSLKPRHVGKPLSAAFASDLEPFVYDCGATLWVHGHVHDACDYVIGNTRVLCNPRGYPDEPADGFDPGLVVEV